VMSWDWRKQGIDDPSIDGATGGAILGRGARFWGALVTKGRGRSTPPKRRLPRPLCAFKLPHGPMARSPRTWSGLGELRPHFGSMDPSNGPLPFSPFIFFFFCKKLGVKRRKMVIAYLGGKGPSGLVERKKRVENRVLRPREV